MTQNLGWSAVINLVGILKYRESVFLNVTAKAYCPAEELLICPTNGGIDTL